MRLVLRRRNGTERNHNNYNYNNNNTWSWGGGSPGTTVIDDDDDGDAHHVPVDVVFGLDAQYHQFGSTRVMFDFNDTCLCRWNREYCVFVTFDLFVGSLTENGSWHWVWRVDRGERRLAATKSFWNQLGMVLCHGQSAHAQQCLSACLPVCLSVFLSDCMHVYVCICI